MAERAEVSESDATAVHESDNNRRNISRDLGTAGVCTVSRDANNFTQCAKFLDQNLLVFRQRTSKNLKTRNDLEHLRVIGKNRSLHDDPTSRENTALWRGVSSWKEGRKTSRFG